MSSATRIPPEALDTWLSSAADALGLDKALIPIPLLLDVAADVAHGVARPAAPLTTFLLGFALGQRSRGDATLEQLSGDLSALAAKWDAREDVKGDTNPGIG